MRDLAPRRADLDPIEIASVDELSALQLERLQWTLRHAYANVPDYRRRFDDAGVHPEDCRSLDDLARFPFTTKDDLRRDYPFGPRDPEDVSRETCGGVRGAARGRGPLRIRRGTRSAVR